MAVQTETKEKKSYIIATAQHYASGQDVEWIDGGDSFNETAVLQLGVTCASTNAYIQMTFKMTAVGKMFTLSYSMIIQASHQEVCSLSNCLLHTLNGKTQTSTLTLTSCQ